VTPPNLLFVLTDQQRGDALGAVSPWIRTPALDRLAREGTRFRRCVTPSPGCIPARFSLMTGLYPHNTGIWTGGHFTLPAEARTWVRAIRDAGYRTSLVGKTHLHPQTGDLRDRRPLVQSWGFDDVTEIAGPHASAWSQSDLTDEWARAGLLDAFVADLEERRSAGGDLVRPSPLGFEHHYDSFVGRRAIELVRGYGSDRPWFLWVGFGGPHEPWDAPEPYASMYDPSELPPPLPPIESVLPDRPRGRLLDERVEQDADRHAALSPDQLAAVRGNYAGKVSLVDHWVGELLAAVEERGDLDRTLVVFASDHGEHAGDHGLFHKNTFLEPSVTVPLVIRLPGAAARVASEPVELIDVGATLADAAGAELGYPQWGRSLLPVVRGDAPFAREFAIVEHRAEAMVVDARWKVAFNSDGAAYQSTDLETDPDERRNLAGTAEVRAVEEAARERLLGRVLQTQLSFDERF
jgi:arylsulfatase